MAMEITDAVFENLSSEKDKLIVVDFSATWCGPCKMVAPIIDELAAEYEGKAVIGKCDVEASADLAARFRIRNVPTVMFIKNGEAIDKLVGANQKSTYVEKIEKYL